MKSSRYLDWFLSLRCAGDLLNMRVFPNTKEITETMGIFNFVATTGLRYDNRDVLAIVVGDGCTPRTGMFLAFNTGWTVYSIDPGLKDEFVAKCKDVKRLFTIKDKIENVNITNIMAGSGRDNVIVMLPHAHVAADKVMKLFTNNEWLTGRHLFCITMECCVDLTIPNRQGIIYKDTGIWSPKNVMTMYDYGVIGEKNN